MQENLTRNILLAMAGGLLVGLGMFWLNNNFPDNGMVGFLQNEVVDGLLKVIAKVFVIMLKMLIVPLVFVSIVCGMLSTGDDVKQFGRLGLKTVLLYLSTTAIAIALALTVAHIIQPGHGVDLANSKALNLNAPPSASAVIINMFPKNPFEALSQGNMLQIIIFAVVLGIAINRSGASGERIGENFKHWNEVMLQLVVIVMSLTPVGVFCLITRVFAEQGPDIFQGLVAYFFTVTFVLALHALGTYGALLKFIAKVSPFRFFSKMRPVALFAFSTASSAATLPMTMKAVEDDIGVDNRIASFALPLGATVNMDGTAIMQGVATVFIAGAYGIDLGFSGYMGVILTATLASIGTAAVPSAGLVTLTLVLQQANLPVEAIGLIIGVDRLLDMMRTAVNVTGDASISTAIASTENAFNREQFDS